MQSNIPIITAFFLGILTSISPCPLATNITAVAFISQKIGHKKYILLAGTIYTLGRMIAYSLVGVLIILIGAKVSTISIFLQNTGEKILGPLFIIIGLILLDAIKISFGKEGGLSKKLSEKVSNWGVWGALLLGFIFALAFCPYSAVLFFGGLIPLSLESKGGITFPAIYAIGTGLPVVFFTLLLSLGVSWLNKAVSKIKTIEKIMRYIAAFTFIGVGIYYLILIFI